MKPGIEANIFNHFDQFHIADVALLYFSFTNFVFFVVIFVVQFNCPNDLARLQLDSS